MTYPDDAEPPFRLRIQRALSELFKTITPDNGYFHDLSEAVFRGRDKFGEEDPVPMVSILEDPREVENESPNESATAVRGPYSLIIQGWVQDDPVNPTDPAHWLMRDVKRALAPEIRKRGAPGGILGLGTGKPCIDALKISGGVVRPPDHLSIKAYFWLKLTLVLVEGHEN